MTNKKNIKSWIIFGATCGMIFTNACSGATVYQRESKTPAQTIQDKSSVFGTQISSESDDKALADQIRAQRNARDAADMRNNTSTQIISGASQINCDNALRKCIESQCGAKYTKCATDSDTTFSDKLNACRKNTTCTAHEFNVFTNEIKADKSHQVLLAQYTATIDCGNRYNDCIISKCGTHFNKCLGKTSGDRAIADCKQIATECNTYDSGLTSRIGSVFATLRTNAQEQIRRDEQRLYALRDQMRQVCESLGAMFDDRTLDCIFTANLYSGDNYDTPVASKKLYAGSVFDCTPDWFGIDITTFKENAYRLTRAQSTASAAMLGSGLGIAAGAITSGAIDRAVTSQEALDKLKTLCDRAGGDVQDGKCIYPDDTETDTQNMNNQNPAQPAENREDSASQKNNNQKKNECEQAGGRLNIFGKCTCPDKDQVYENAKCITITISRQDCERSAGKYVFDPELNEYSCDWTEHNEKLEKQGEPCRTSGGKWVIHWSPDHSGPAEGLCECQYGYDYDRAICRKLPPATNIENPARQQSPSTTSQHTNQQTKIHEITQNDVKTLRQQKNSSIASQYTPQSITNRVLNGRNDIK